MAEGKIAVHDDSLYYTPGTYTLNSVHVYGFVSSNARDARISFTPGKSLAFCKSVTINNAQWAYIRTTSGGFIGGSGANLTSYVQEVYFNDGTISIKFYNEAGWGTTNNTPIAGEINVLTFTVT